MYKCKYTSVHCTLYTCIKSHEINFFTIHSLKSMSQNFHKEIDGSADKLFR